MGGKLKQFPVNIYLLLQFLVRYAPRILAPAGSTCAFGAFLGPMPIRNFVFHGHIREVSFFEVFRSDVCSQVMRSSMLASRFWPLRARICRSAKITEYTLDTPNQLLLSCPPQNYALLKEYYMHAHVYARCARVRARRVLRFFLLHP